MNYWPGCRVFGQATILLCMLVVFAGIAANPFHLSGVHPKTESAFMFSGHSFVRDSVSVSDASPYDQDVTRSLSEIDFVDKDGFLKDGERIAGYHQVLGQFFPVSVQETSRHFLYRHIHLRLTDSIRNILRWGTPAIDSIETILGISAFPDVDMYPRPFNIYDGLSIQQGGRGTRLRRIYAPSSKYILPYKETQPYPRAEDAHNADEKLFFAVAIHLIGVVLLFVAIGDIIGGWRNSVVGRGILLFVVSGFLICGSCWALFAIWFRL